MTEYDVFVRHSFHAGFTFFFVSAVCVAVVYFIRDRVDGRRASRETRMHRRSQGATYVIALFVLATFCAIALLSPLPGRAQTTQHMPSDEQISAERARIEQERKPMFDDPQIGQSAAGNVFPNIPTPARGAADPLAVAQRYAARASARKQEELLAFASLSMPASSLKRLVSDTARVGGIVVLRGFKDRSFKATATAIQALGVDTSAVQINPQAFRQYRIERVPAVVLVKPGSAGPDVSLDSAGCSLPENYAGVSGDVSLAYALSEIDRRAPDYHPLVQRLLASLGAH